MIEESIIDKNGVETVVSQTSYNLAGEVESVTNSKGETTTYSKEIDPEGYTVNTTTFHDGSDSVTKSFADGRTFQVTGARSITKTYEYGINTDGTEWTKEYIGLIGDSEWTKTTRNLQGATISVEKANGAISSNHYNNDGQLEKAVDFDGVTTLYSYLPNGDAEYVALDINQNGIIDLAGPDQISQTISDISSYNDEPVYRTRNYTWFEGSSTGNLISTSYRSIDGQRSWSESNGLVSNSETTVDATNKTKTVTSTLACSDGSCVDKVSTQNYENGLLTSQNVVDAGGNVVSSVTYSYDELNRVESQTDHTGRTTTFGYEGVTGERTSTTVVGGDLSQTTSITEEADNVTKSTLADGTFVFTQKNLQGQIIKRWGSRVYPVEYTYENSRIKTMTTWKNFDTSEGAAVTTWNYDNVGNLESKVFDQGNATVYTYTDGGKLKTRTWVRGIVTTYEYDSAGRLESTSFDDGTDSISLSYDRLGRKSSVTDASGTRIFTYSSTGQLASESFSSGLFQGFSFSQSSDGFGRRNSFTLNDGLEDVYSISYGHDSAGRLNKFVQGDLEAKYGFHQNGQVDSLVIRNDGVGVVSTNKSFDGLGRLSSVHHSDFNSTVQSFDYDLNDANQRTKVTEADNSYWVYTYDEMGQLTSGQKYLADGTAIQGLSFGYDFDSIGNRKSTTVNNQIASYTSNSLNQYEQREVPAVVDVTGKSDAADVTVDDLVTVRNEEFYNSQVALDNSVTVPYALEIKENGVLTKTQEGYLRSSPEFMSYDVDGDMTADGLWDYTWNGENRLIGMTHKFENLELQFAYDSQGRRFRKRVLRDGILTLERRYLYDGYNCVAELDENNELVKSYMWGLDLSGSEQGAGGVGGLLAVTEYSSSSTSYVLMDGNGNATGAVDSDSGELVYSVEYSPFGKVLVENGVAVSDYGFSTKPLDSETGLNYYNFRYYSSDAGRWISRDPAQEGGSRNLYAFINNDPMNYVDLLGLVEIPSLNDILDQIHNNAFENYTQQETEVFKQFISYLKQIDGVTEILTALLRSRLENNARDQIAHEMYDHYLTKTGSPYFLTPEEMKIMSENAIAGGGLNRLNIATTGRHLITGPNGPSAAPLEYNPEWATKVAASLNGSAQEYSGQITWGYANGSISAYQVYFAGTICRGTWEGYVAFKDRFDLDPNWSHPNLNSAGYARPWGGERHTRIGYILDLGRDFDVLGLPVKARQSSDAGSVLEILSGDAQINYSQAQGLLNEMF